MCESKRRRSFCALKDRHRKWMTHENETFFFQTIQPDAACRELRENETAQRTIIIILENYARSNWMRSMFVFFRPFLQLNATPFILTIENWCTTLAAKRYYRYRSLTLTVYYYIILLFPTSYYFRAPFLFGGKCSGRVCVFGFDGKNEIL